MILRGAGLRTVGLIGLLSACDILSQGDAPTPYFQATLQGAVQAEYEGTGEYSWATRSEELVLFGVNSRNDDGSERFAITYYLGDHRAPRGSNAVTLEPSRLRVHDPEPGWVLIQYFRGQTGSADRYVVDSGTIEIDHSGVDYSAWMRQREDGWVEGHFSVSAVRYCGGVQGVDYYCPHLSELPDQLPADLPRIHVTGSFVATASDNVLHTGCDPICSDQE